MSLAAFLRSNLRYHLALRGLTHCGMNKMPPFSRRQFQIHFLDRQLILLFWLKFHIIVFVRKALTDKQSEFARVIDVIYMTRLLTPCGVTRPKLFIIWMACVLCLYIEDKINAFVGLLRLHLHSRLNTWLHWIATWGPPGTYRPQMGPMLAPWTSLSGAAFSLNQTKVVHGVFISKFSSSYFELIKFYTRGYTATISQHLKAATSHEIT